MAATESVVDVFIQARMGSIRLPGKSLKPVAGKALLERVVEGAAAAKLVRRVVVCTSDTESDDAIAAFAKQKGTNCFRGSEKDVLRRFLDAAEFYQSEIVVRVCADNPFLNGGEIDRLILAFAAGDFDYGMNHIPVAGNGYPDGLGAEIVRIGVLKQAYPETDAGHREHVTQFITQREGRYRILRVQAPENIAYPEIKLDIDTAEDFQRIEAFINFLQERGVDHQNAEEVCLAYLEFEK